MSSGSHDFMIGCGLITIVFCSITTWIGKKVFTFYGKLKLHQNISVRDVNIDNSALLVAWLKSMTVRIAVTRAYRREWVREVQFLDQKYNLHAFLNIRTSIKMWEWYKKSNYTFVILYWTAISDSNSDFIKHFTEKHWDGVQLSCPFFLSSYFLILYR